MKKQYEMPLMAVNVFDKEDVVVASGGDNVSRMKDNMTNNGYTVETFDLRGIFGE